MAKCNDANCRVCYPKPKPPAPPETPPAPIYDEQLRLLGEDNIPAARLPYSILLGDGTRRSGLTDDNGCTERVVTLRATAILSVTLTPPSDAEPMSCCSTDEAGLSSERIYINSRDGVLATTNGTNVGSSTVKVRLPHGNKRDLTRGEIALARTVFGDGVDYARVKVHHGGWWLFLGLQESHTAVTPNGEMYFPRAIYRDEFASDDDRDRRIFMHEMAHVWQYQMGYSAKRHGLTVTIRGASAYDYTLTPISRLRDFNMEQQGNIFSDYYMICIRNNPARAYNPDMDPELLSQDNESLC